VAGGDLHVAEADAGVAHGYDEGVAQHVRVRPWHLDSGGRGQALEPAGRCVPVHPRAEGVTQDLASVAVVDRPVDRPGHCRRERNEDDLASLASDPQNPVAVFLTEVANVRAAGFEDPQPEETEQRNQREVVRVVRQPRGGDQRFELQMAQPEGR
jgi:hypothetical protein